MEKFYSNLGRRSIDPVLMFKMLLIGYLFNIRSERELEEQVHLNIAYRWFLGLDLSDQVPDHSTFSQNRRRRFKDSNVIQEVFDHVVKLCIQEGENVDQQEDTFAYTALHNAASKGYVEIVKELINAKANVFIKNQTGETALELALWKHQNTQKEIEKYTEISILLNQQLGKMQENIS